MVNRAKGWYNQAGGQREVVVSEQRLFLRVRFPHPPRVVFERVWDPGMLQQWLDLASVKAVRKEGRLVARRVGIDLPGGLSTTIEERIVDLDPPSRLSYVARKNLLFKAYAGDVRLPTTLDGCLLEWTIRLDTWLPGMASVAKVEVERLFRRGLRRLEVILGPTHEQARSGEVMRIPGDTSSPASTPEDEAEYPGLLAEAQRIQEAQYRRALALVEDGEVKDTRYWFLYLDSLAMAYLLDRVQTGCFAHPCWVLRVAIAAHRYMEASLVAAETSRGRPESHWQSWLRATANASRWWSSPARAAAHSVAKGTYLYISEDYPRALAEVFTRHYLGRATVTYDTFLPDWRAMVPAYDQAWNLVRPSLDLLLGPMEHTKLGWHRKHVVFQDPLTGLQRQLQRAWERGERLLTLVETLADVVG